MLKITTWSVSDSVISASVTNLTRADVDRPLIDDCGDHAIVVTRQRFLVSQTVL